MEDKIIKEKVFNHSIDKVWNAITRAEEISKWFIHADFKAEKGYKYTLKAKEEHGATQITGKILEADPYTLKYTWNVGASVETTVTWTLEEEGDKTKLTLVHAGISEFGEEKATEMMGLFEQGWDACLSVLPNYLNDEETEPTH